MMPDQGFSAPTSLPVVFGIEAIGITKRFGEFTALDNVSLKVAGGSFHALLGENGAGKSTLVKCIMGYHRPDQGAVVVADREQVIASPRAAHALGLGMVYQHFTLVPAMTVAENLVLSRPTLPAVLDWRAENAALAAFMARMPFAVPLAERISALSAGERQKCEILKQLYLDRRFLVLDEPTSVLTPQEADEMLGLLRAMTDAAKLTVLMITHKFREVMAFADRVTILRRGRVAGGGAVADLTPEAMAQMMVGLEIPPAAATHRGRTGDSRLDIRGLEVEDDAGQPAVQGLSLGVRAGEIVGIAGVAGNGQHELIEALAGQRERARGEVRVGGEAYHATRAEMQRHKVCCLPEEPLRNACVGRMSVAENLAFREFDRPPLAIAGAWLRATAFRAAAEDKIRDYGIRTRSPETPLAALSGGNVQRAVLARELDERPEVLIAANPCFGLDFAATAQIRTELLAARNRGAAVLLISSDLDEILELADRICVIFDGRLVYEVAAENADLTEIGRHMAGR
ncbi:MAG TPA: ABC transporter ATP-binding protein [Stellaceae bacterium]|nr:ABC transporter ATP-binding protein [Stellaceae bacterium]